MASPSKESQERVFHVSGSIALHENNNQATSTFNILGGGESLKPGSRMALRGLRSRRYARKPTPRELYHGNLPCSTLEPPAGFDNFRTTSQNPRDLDGLATPPDENLNPLARLGTSGTLIVDLASNVHPELLSGNSDAAVSPKRRKVSSIHPHAILPPIYVSTPPTPINLWPVVSERRVGLPSRREFV